MEIEFEKLQWAQHSHVTMATYYLNTQVTELAGKKYYRHTRTQRTEAGMGMGSSKVTYSETLESEDLTEKALWNLIEVASKKSTRKNNEMEPGQPRD